MVFHFSFIYLNHHSSKRSARHGALISVSKLTDSRVQKLTHNALLPSLHICFTNQLACLASGLLTSCYAVQMVLK